MGENKRNKQSVLADLEQCIERLYSANTRVGLVAARTHLAAQVVDDTQSQKRIASVSDALDEVADRIQRLAGMLHAERKHLGGVKSIRATETNDINELDDVGAAIKADAQGVK